MQNYKFSNIYARLDKSYDIMHTYCKLVEDCYKNVLGLSKYQVNPHDIIFDNMAYPVIIMSKKEIIGGAVLYIRAIGDNKRLPLEKSANINIEDIVTNIDLKSSKNICEISKIAVHGKYRDRRITQEILGLILAKAVKEQCDYMFAITPKKRSRNFRIVYNKLGINYDVINKAIPKIPLYEDLDIDLTYANFKTFDLSKLLSSCHFNKLIAEMYNIAGNSYSSDSLTRTLNSKIWSGL